MTVNIDTANGTCSTTLENATQTCAIKHVRVSTDPAARMSMAHISGHSVHVTEDMAEHLIAAGAKDDRKNLVVDD